MPFFYALTGITIARLLFQWSDKPVDIKKGALMLAFEIVLLSPVFSHYWLILLLFLISLQIIIILTESYSKPKYKARTIQLLYFVFFSACFWSHADPASGFNNTALSLFQFCKNNLLFMSVVSNRQLEHYFIYLAGALLLINEVNNLIRFILESFRIIQPAGNEPISPLNIVVPKTGVTREELNRGRLIGIFERVLIFVFTITGNLTLIGFILTAKIFTRYKRLDDQAFAEYVLIGTLLSSSFSLIAGLVVKIIVKAIV